MGLLAVGMVVTSLSRPEPPTFSPTPAAPAEVGDATVGPVTYTLDASDPDAWRYFDFSSGSVVSGPGPHDWDLAFRRFEILVNGGPGFGGEGGAVWLAGAAFDSMRVAPDSGYVQNAVARDSVNTALEDWYDYGFTSHLLTPKRGVYVMRTADGRYAKLELLSYYCPGALPGCHTFRYLYRGDGGRDLTGSGPGRRSPSAASPR